MILRQTIRQQARRVVPSPSVTFRRFAATEADGLAASLANSTQETLALDTALNSSATTPILSQHASTSDQASVAENFHLRKHIAKQFQNSGTVVAPHYQPHSLVNNPPSVSDVTLELLLASEAHQGHSTSIWNPANAKYIFGVRQGIHIISLEATAAYLRRASRVVTEVVRRGGLILFVGTRAGHNRCVIKAAELSGGCHLFERWIPGSITNGEQILHRCSKKVVNEFDDTIGGFESQLSDRPSIKPDLVVCLNPLENYILLHECGLHNVPTIGIIDTNADPTWVTYPIPANDDSLRCVQVIAGVLGRAGEAGKKLRLEAAEAGQITYVGDATLTRPPRESA